MGEVGIDNVVMQVRALEDNPLFNAGKGSVLTHKGTVEMEASIMDGKTKKCGAVSGLSTVVHPVSLARKVMEESPHVYLAFHGAEEFARLKVTKPYHTIPSQQQQSNNQLTLMLSSRHHSM